MSKKTHLSEGGTKKGGINPKPKTPRPPAPPAQKPPNRNGN